MIALPHVCFWLSRLKSQQKQIFIRGVPISTRPFTLSSCKNRPDMSRKEWVNLAKLKNHHVNFFSLFGSSLFITWPWPEGIELLLSKDFAGYTGEGFLTRPLTASKSAEVFPAQCPLAGPFIGRFGSRMGDSLLDPFCLIFIHHLSQQPLPPPCFSPPRTGPY